MESQFQTIPINITGPSYQDRSRPLSSQETINFYHEVVEAGKDKYVIKSFPGQKNLGSVTGNDQGGHEMNEVAYRVCNRTLYEVSADGTHTSRGTITSNDRCIFDDDGVNLFIVAGGEVSQYDSATQSLSVVTDVNIVGAESVAYLNSQFAYTNPNAHPNKTLISPDGSTGSGLEVVGEDTDPDALVRDYWFDQILYRFGKKSTVSWWNDGVSTPPIVRVTGQMFNIGLGALHSVAHTREFMYWLGNDGNVYQARGGQEAIISTAAIAGEIQKEDFSNAYGETFTIDNKSVYMLCASKTWLLFEELGKDGWIQLTQGTEGAKFNASSVIEAYNKVLIGDLTGDLNYLDFDTYTINDATWQRRRVISSINGDLLGQKGRRVEMSRLEFILETGVGLISGQGEDPKIMIEASFDGGKSWATGNWLRIGRLGETNIRAQWFKMKSFYDMMVRITTSDPVAFNLYSGAIDLRLAGE